MPRKKKTTKVAIITDTHYGMRKGSQIFHDYFEDFYERTFFPTLESHGIDTVLHLGDVFDVRKGIDYWSLDWAKRVVFQPLLDRQIDTHIIVGNHDIFYRQSLKLNAPGLNLNQFSNITTYDRPQTATIKGTDIFMVPWVCEDNADEFVAERDTPKQRLLWVTLNWLGSMPTALTRSSTVWIWVCSHSSILSSLVTSIRRTAVVT